MAVPEWANYIMDHLQGKELVLRRHRKWAIENEASSYELIGSQLYNKGKDHNRWLCVPKEKYIQILKHAHFGIAGGHFSIGTITKTILWYELWLLALHMDAKLFVSRCIECQKTKPPGAQNSMPL